MTKKHFIALADALKAIKPTLPPESQSLSYVMAVGRDAQWQATVDAIGSLCAQDNPSFDRQLWIGYINGTNTANGKAITK